MYLSGVSFENIRCFKGSHSISFEREEGVYAGWTVVAGRNGVGKTSFLKALVAGVSGKSLGLVLNYMDRVSTRSGALDEEEVSSLVRVDLALEGKGVGFRGFKVKSFHRTGGVFRLDYELLQGVYGDEESVFLTAYSSSRRLTGIKPQQSTGFVFSVFNLIDGDAGLYGAISWLQHLQFQAVEGRADAAQLRDDVLALLNDGLLPDKSHIEKVNSDGVWIVRDGVELPLELASDGYRAMIALIVDMAHKISVHFKGLDLQRDARGHVSCPHPAVVLIDEIDAHLHVEWQQRIGFWLKRHFPKIQFIVTTHSPFVCQAADRRGIIRLPAPGEDRTIEHVSEETWKTLVRGGIDQAVMTDLFGLGHPHSDETEALQDELADLQSKALRGLDLTPEEEARAEELMGQLSGDLTTQVDVAMKAVGVRHAED